MRKPKLCSTYAMTITLQYLNTRMEFTKFKKVDTGENGALLHFVLKLFLSGHCLKISSEILMREHERKREVLNNRKQVSSRPNCQHYFYVKRS